MRARNLQYITCTHCAVKYHYQSTTKDRVVSNSTTPIQTVSKAGFTLRMKTVCYKVHRCSSLSQPSLQKHSCLSVYGLRVVSNACCRRRRQEARLIDADWRRAVQMDLLAYFAYFVGITFQWNMNVVLLLETAYTSILLWMCSYQSAETICS